MVWLAIILGLVASAPSSSPAPAPVPERSRRGPNEAWAGDLHVVQLWSDSQERFLKQWAQPTPPSLTTTSTIERNKPIFLFVIFDSCKADVNGKCNLVGSIDIIDPDGATYDRHDGVKFWDNQLAPKSGILALSPGGMGLVIENGEKLGRYSMRVAVTDTVANVTARTEDTITVVEAGAR